MAIRPGGTAAYDPATRAVVPIEAGWLAAAQQDIADGLADLQRAAADPEPAPWIQAAQQQFDEAFAELSTKTAIGG